MTEHRAKPGDLCMSDAMPFQQHWSYRTTLPLADAITDTFFLPVAPNLRPGDSITMVSYDRPSFGRVVEFSTVMVVEKRQDAVELVVTAAPEAVPARESAPASSDDGPAPEYIRGNGKAVWNPGKRAYDIKVGNDVVAVIADKDEAHKIARGDIPMPVAA